MHDWVWSAWIVGSQLQRLKYIQHVIQFCCLPLQSLTGSDVQLIASSVEHHPSLRELTVQWCSESLAKGAVEGMTRRHGVEKLVVVPHISGECLLCIVIPLYALTGSSKWCPQSMLHWYMTWKHKRIQLIPTHWSAHGLVESMLNSQRYIASAEVVISANVYMRNGDCTSIRSNLCSVPCLYMYK